MIKNNLIRKVDGDNIIIRYMQEDSSQFSGGWSGSGSPSPKKEKR